MIERWRDFVRRLSLVCILPKQIKEPPRLIGPGRTLTEWRVDIMRGRQDLIGKPGLYLDSGPTGSGKSTADIESVRRVSRALIVTPCHKDGEEIVEDMHKAGIDAMKYPARSTDGKFVNCWNDLADTAERLGLSAVAAVCPGCSHLAQCLQHGYRAELSAVKSASVAVATHARATFTGFDKLAEGRGEFVAVHEDTSNTICPDATVLVADLQLAAEIVKRVLTDPTWLDWLGQATSRDEDGVWIVECPSIPGCVSQGETKNEAIENIKDAIKVCLEVRAEKGLPLTVETRQVEVAA